MKQSSTTYLFTLEPTSEYAIFIALSILVNLIFENFTKHKRALIKVSKNKTMILLNAFKFPFYQNQCKFICMCLHIHIHICKYTYFNTRKQSSGAVEWPECSWFAFITFSSCIFPCYSFFLSSCVSVVPFSYLYLCIIPSLGNPVLIVQATYDIICSPTLTVTRICLCPSPNLNPMLLKYVI